MQASEPPPPTPTEARLLKDFAALRAIVLNLHEAVIRGVPITRDWEAIDCGCRGRIKDLC
jgi:hypothetical protein